MAREQGRFGFLESLQRQITGDRGKTDEKPLHAVSRFEVVEQGAHKNSRAAKSWFTRHDRRIANDNGFHSSSVPLLREGWVMDPQIHGRVCLEADSRIMRLHPRFDEKWLDAPRFPLRILRLTASVCRQPRPFSSTPLSTRPDRSPHLPPGLPRAHILLAGLRPESAR